jgi:hypothetical protein
LTREHQGAWPQRPKRPLAADLSELVQIFRQKYGDLQINHGDLTMQYIYIYQCMGICVSVLLKYVGGWIDFMGNFRVETPWFSPPRCWGKLQQQSMGISPLPKCGRDNQPS